MEEQKNSQGTGMGGMMKGKVCDCGCGCGWVHGHRIFRVILALVVLVIVFGLGVKAGEMKSRMHGFGGRGYYDRMQPMMIYNGATLPVQMMNGTAAQPGAAGAPTK